MEVGNIATLSFVAILSVAFVPVFTVIYFRLSERVFNSDDSDERRKLYRRSVEIPSNLKHEESWIPNKRGMLIYRQSFIPTEFKAVVCLVHGFGDHSGNLYMDLSIMLAKAGYAVVSIDFEGHGRSDGLHCFIPSLKFLADDLTQYLKCVSNQEIFRGKKLFLYGESMGGATTFFTSVRPDVPAISGLILVAPMIKISDKMKPPQVVIDFLIWLSKYLPTSPIAPVPDILDKCFKRREILLRARSDPLAYKKKPRLQSSVAMLNATIELGSRMEDLHHPTLILHGGADEVTDPEISKELYNRCSSVDKTLKLYPGCWHNLVFGEPEEQGKVVFEDIIRWMEMRL